MEGSMSARRLCAPLAVAVLLVLGVLAGQATAHHRDGHAGGPPAEKAKGKASDPATSADLCEGDCPIQPGALLGTPEGLCTMNFVFEDGAGRLYIGTAGHCFDREGQRAEAEPEPGSLLSMIDPLFEFGTAVHVEFSEDEPSIDFALIEIDPDQYGNVNPSMRFWGGPAGSTTADETSTGDPLLQYGYGAGFDLTPVTRPRIRVLMDDDAEHYTSQSASMFGDSGSPVLHEPTGKAHGIDSRFNFFDIPPTIDAGPTVEGILRRLADAGHDVTLVTAPFE
jgi:hypothetical protein